MKALPASGTIPGARLVPGSGDASITMLLQKAAKMKCAVRFLRLAMPERFRNEVSSPARRGSLSRRIRLLISGDVPLVEFLLVNPSSPAFLTRMDVEGKGNDEIWRVRNEILNFAEDLLKLRSLVPKNRTPAVSVAFHSRHLIWNLGIVGTSMVVARAYHSISTGHDPAGWELHLQAGAESRLAEALISFYDATKADCETLAVTAADDLSNLGSWPSLFKCNVVLAEPSGNSIKVLSSGESRDREDHWLCRLQPESLGTAAFRPPKPAKDKTQAPWGWGAAAFSEEGISGVDGGRVLHTLSLLASEVPSLAKKAACAGELIIKEAFQALQEFRFQSNRSYRSTDVRFKQDRYPWREKLFDAFSESFHILGVKASIIKGCHDETEELARRMKKPSKFPFRDANIKNRLFTFDPACSARTLREWLQAVDPDALASELRSKTRDVDFEMCHWRVTEWDDPFHLLFCPFIDLGFLNSQAMINTQAFSQWWRPAGISGAQEVMWETFLLRSLRELLRRLWYANVMPRTYQRRYSREPRDHFLSLARGFVKKTRGTTSLEELIEHIWERREQLWGGVLANELRPRLKATREAVLAVGTMKPVGTIAKGARTASQFHQTAVSIIREAFDGMLGYCEIEAELHEGRKRVDAVFVNVAPNGFFHDLRKVVPCSYVFVECKNYSGTVGNREVDQLLGRFSPIIGCFGILCCREGRNRRPLLRRCKDVWRDKRGLIVTLCDSDLDQLTRMSEVHDLNGVNCLMMSRVHEVTLDRRISEKG